MVNETVSIQVTDTKSITGVISTPDRSENIGKTGVILAHGAANDMNHPLLVFLAQGLAEAGFITLRFNFLYREQGDENPDSQGVLEKTWLGVYDFLSRSSRHKVDKIILMGKSMGGRVASQMVAGGVMNPDRLIFLGYPLHAPGKKDKLRDSHLYRIVSPMFFFAGTRDPFCDLTLLNGVLEKLNCPWDLEIIEGGDHSFKLPKTASKTDMDVHDDILEKSLEWVRREDKDGSGTGLYSSV